MKKLLIILGIIVLASCSSRNPEDEKKIQLSQLRQKSLALNNEIAELEKEMTKDSLMSDENNLIPVTVKEIAKEEFRHFIDSYGKVEAEENAFISPEMGGQIKAIHVSEGERVNKGQLMVSLNTSVTQSTINEVKKSLELAELIYNKQKTLWEKSIGSELQYLEAQNAYESAKTRLKTLEAQLDMSLIRAPFNGIVDRIYLKEGEMAMPGMQIMQLVNLKKIIIKTDVSETYLGTVRKGEKVEVQFPSLEKLNQTVYVYRTGHVIEPKSRTFVVELKLDNAGELIKPNMVSVVRINDYSNPAAIVIPSIIIKQDIRGLYVYTAVKDGHDHIARKVYIQTGLSYEDQTMIIGGLSENQMVVVKGYNMVTDEMKIKIVGSV